MSSDLDHSLISLSKVHAELLVKFEALKSKLADSHQTLELIIGHLSEGLIFVNTEGIIKLFNPAAATLTNLSQKEVLESPFWDHFPDTFFGFSLSENLKDVSSHHRVVLTLNDSQEIELTTSPVPNKGLLLLLRDRTEILQLERTIHHGEQLAKLGEMAATLAHEIRNPLGGVEGLARLLQRDLKDNSLLEGILEGTRIINTLITNVLDYARPLKLHFAPTEIVSLVEETLASDPLFATCRFVKKIPSWTASVDRDRIRLVLLNLLRNAYEAKSSTVEITLATDGRLSIKDDGRGIAEEHLSKIFTPFFTTKPTGTGLGLAEAAKVLEGHGGRLTVSSKKGETLFTLEFAHDH